MRTQHRDGAGCRTPRCNRRCHPTRPGPQADHRL